MDDTLRPPAPAQPAEAQPGAKQEWTVPALKELDLTQTRFGDDPFDYGLDTHS